MKTNVRDEFARVWPAIAFLGGAQLLMATLAVLPAIVGVATLGHRPALTAAADGDWLNVIAYAVAELRADADVKTAQLGSELRQAANVTMLTILTAPIAAVGYALLYTFASGAALALLADPTISLWRAGSSHFWPMLRVSLLVYPTSAALLIVAAILLALIQSDTLVSMLILAIALILLGALFELTRAGIVHYRSRHVLRSLWAALGLVGRHPLATFGTWLALSLGNALILVGVSILTLGTSANNAFVAWACALVAILFGAGYKVFRLVMQSYLWRSFG